MSLEQRAKGGREDDRPTALIASLDSSVPEFLPPGQADAVFLHGACHAPDRDIVRLGITVDGEYRPVNAWGMPRPDIFEREGTARSRHSGFWATVPVPAQSASGRVDIRAHADFADGGTGEHRLAQIGIRDPEPARATVSRELTGRPQPRDLIAICMATYNPEIELFQIQIESIRSQTDENWFCIVSDDCSEPATFAALTDVIGDDPRFLVSRSETRIGFYRNFERALTLAPGSAGLITLSDQDDRWYPEKLAVLRETLGDAQLVHSDLRMVDREGTVLAGTLWEGRRNNRTNFGSMLLSNTITGAAMLFRRPVLDTALPFPEGPGWQFHDHWLSTVAMATGELAYAEQPLYDHVQHAGAITGQVAVEDSAESPAGILPRLKALATVPRGAFGRWRAAYFRTYIQLQLHAEVILARCTALPPGRRRTLRLVARADRSLTGTLWLAVRCLRPLFGRNETLGTEQMLLGGLLWRRLIGPRSRLQRKGTGLRLSAALPPLEVDRLGTRRLRRWRANL